MLLVSILVLPVLGAVAIALGRGSQLSAWIAVVSNVGAMALGIGSAVEVVAHGPIDGANGLVRADALSAFMVIVVASIAVIASWVGTSVVADTRDRLGAYRRATLYAVLVQLFITAMLLAVLAANVGVLWVAVEATTIVTTFLVGHHRTRTSIEAAWKYIVICSVGIALALLGTVVFYLAAIHAGDRSATALDWTSLMAIAPRLNPSVLRLGFGLIVLGYGTKVGLAPMHSWLPDAHSEAPAPMSALMSGVLLTVAFYAILRFKAVVDVAVGPNFARTFLVIAGLFTLAVAASLLITQRNYKRLLAYSSIEHMGLLALGAAAGTTLAITAVLLQILGHGLAKSVLFCASGEVAASERTTDIESVRALITRRPVLGAIFGAGFVAVLGMPPFSLFTSELAMARAEFGVGLGWAASAGIGAMFVIFAAVAGRVLPMLLGSGVVATGYRPRMLTALPMIAALTMCALIGVVSWPLAGLLHAAAQVVAR